MSKKKLAYLTILGLAALAAAPSVSAAENGETGAGIDFVEDTRPTLPPSVTDPDTQLPDTAFPGGERPEILNPGVEVPTEPDYPNVVVPAPNASLALTQFPKEFNFGVQAVDATINFDTAIHSFEQEEGQMDFSSYSQGVQVLDGRMNQHDWHLTAELSGFTALTGATITLHNSNLQVSKGSARKGDGFAADVFEINATAKSLLTADPMAKGYTSLSWESAEDVKFNVSGQNIRTGSHTGKVTWTLNAAPES